MMAHSQATIAAVVTIALEDQVRRHRGTEQGRIAEEMLAKHLARLDAQTLSHAGVSYPQTAGEA